MTGKARLITDHSLLSINTATTREQWSLAEAIEGYVRLGVGGISPWRDQIADMGLAHAAKAIRDAGINVTGVCRGGMFPWSDAPGRQDMLDDNRRAIEEAATLRAQCLVLVVGGLPRGSKDLPGARMMVEEAIAALLPEARAAGVPLAIEPLHPMYAADRACVNTMRQALDLCDRMGDGVGVAIDVYHVWWDPELQAQIKRAGKKRILAFHICDWLVPTRDLLLDRGMMGDGVIDIPLLRSWVENAGYEGFHEVEIFSKENWWRCPPDDLVAICKERYLSVV
ncbi:MAG: sugar phosphate isomerase/epimerase [Fimbriimonadaceae bacterium]|nr:sugar phosphate isomerase/epimerase [Alphaproteobacteria bacterium]